MTRRGPALAGRTAAVAATLAGLWLRLYDLGAQPLWSDEGLSLHRAALGARDLALGRIIVDGTATIDPMPPLYFALLAAARPWLGDGIWAQRFVGAALATAAVPLAWVAATRLFGRAAGVTAAVLAAAAPLAVWYAQELRPYGLVLAAVLAATAIAARPAVDGGGAVRRGAHWLAAGAVAAGLHPFAAFAVLAQAPRVVWPAWRAARRRTRRVVAAAAAATLALAAPRVVAVLGGPAQVDFTAVPAAEVVRQALAAFAVGLSPSLAQPWPRIAPLAALAVAGLAAGVADRRRRRGVAMACAMLVTPVAGVLALSAFNPLYNGPRHVLPALPGFLLLAAAAAALPGPMRRPPGSRGRRGAAPWRGDARGAGVVVAVVAAGLVAVLATTSLAVSARQLQRQFGGSPHRKDDIRQLVEDLAVRVRTGDAVVLHDALIGFTFDAEARALGLAWPWQPIPHFPNEDEAAAAGRLAALDPGSGGRIWFVDRPVPRGGFPAAPLVEVADERFTRLDRRQYDRMWLEVGLRAYDRPDRRPIGAARPISAALAAWSNGLALNDVRLEATPVTAGASLRLAADWQRHAAVGGDAAYALRLVGRGGAPPIDLGSDRAVPGRAVDDVPLGDVAAVALDAVVPVDAPAGRHAIEIRLVDVGQGEPSPLDGDPASPWRPVGEVDVGPAALPPAALRALQAHRPGWRAAPARWAGPWRLVAASRVPPTATAAGAMALLVSWQWDPSTADEGTAAGEAAAGARWAAALRLVDAAGRELARASTPLAAPARTGGLATAAVTLAVPADAAGRLAVETAMLDGGTTDGVAVAMRGRWWPAGAWVTLGRTQAVAGAASARAANGWSLSPSSPSTTLAASSRRPPHEAP